MIIHWDGQEKRSRKRQGTCDVLSTSLYFYVSLCAIAITAL